MRILLTQTERLDELLIAFAVLPSKIAKESGTLSDEHDKPTTRRVVLAMRLEVIRYVTDALRQNGDLHLGRARVLLVRPEALDELDALVLRHHRFVIMGLKSAF